MTKKVSAEVFYVQQNPNGLTPEELAKELGKSVTTIKKWLKANKPAVEKIVEEVKSVVEEPVVKKPTAVDVGSLMATRSKNGVNIATVMTEAASAAGDVARSTRPARMGEQLKSAIHKCKTAPRPAN